MKGDHPYKPIASFIDDLQGHPIYPFRGAFSPLLTWFPWHGVDTSEFFPLLGMSRGRDNFVVISETRYKAYALEMFRSYLDSKISIADLYKKYDEIAEKIKILYDEVLKTDISTADDDSLSKISLQAHRYFSELLGRTLYIETFDKEIAEKVLGDKKELLDLIWEQGTHPAFVSFDLRRIEDIVRLIENHTGADLIRRATYVYTDYYMPQPAEMIEQNLLQIKSHLKEEKQKIADRKLQLEKEVELHKKWYASLGEKMKKAVDYFQCIMELRDKRKDPVAYLQVVLAFTGVELARRAGISENIVPLIFGSEYGNGVAWLRENKIDLEKRLEGFVARIHEDGTYTTEFKDFDEAFKHLHDEMAKIHEHTLVVKGNVASPGKATGRVRIILDMQSYKVFEKGDILVTSMTRPEFVPLMKQAAAIITNEGGITCHAAIVSRELKIPCIIGTKNATQILKDGDMVEVDANKGIINII